jgi:hypothetical protein
MKCQSDYDKEAESLLRQADECVEQWWEGEGESPEGVRTRPLEEVDLDSVAVKEALRRGLLRIDEEAGICMSCPKEHSKELDSK